MLRLWLMPFVLLSTVAHAIAQPVVQWDPDLAVRGGRRGVGGPVRALVVYQDHVYVGGIFEDAGPLSQVGSIAAFDGKCWLAAIDGVRDMMGGAGVVNDLAVASVDGFERLIVAGDFAMAGAVTANNVAAWDGTIWHAMDNGLPSSIPFVTSIVAIGEQIFCCSPSTPEFIWEWNQTTDVWERFDDEAIVVDDGRLGVGRVALGGSPTLLHGASVIYTVSPPEFADGPQTIGLTDSLVPLSGIPTCGVGFESRGFANTMIDGLGSLQLWLTGGPDLGGDGSPPGCSQRPTSMIQMWDGMDYQSPFVVRGQGNVLLNAPDGLISVSGLIAGGAFTTSVGGPSLGAIIHFDGTAVTPLFEGACGQIQDAVIHDGFLYVAGTLTSVGSATCDTSAPTHLAVSNFARFGPTCPGDWDGNGGVGIDDWIAFYTDYVNGNLCADFSGSGSIGVQDIFDFLAVYIPNNGRVCSP